MLAQLDMAQPVLAVLQSSMKVSMVMRNFVSSVCVVLGGGRTEEWNIIKLCNKGVWSFRRDGVSHAQRRFLRVNVNLYQTHKL